MSFSFSSVGQDAEVTKDKIEADNYLPDPVKEYLNMGIDALVERHGDEVTIHASAYGHLHNGVEGNSETTNATITVAKA